MGHPDTRQHPAAAGGLLYACGRAGRHAAGPRARPDRRDRIGRGPFVFQATFSLWASLPDAQGFAYREAQHAEAIRRTRAEGWYREELFARFNPIAAYGSWDGIDPLAAYLGMMSRRDSD